MRAYGLWPQWTANDLQELSGSHAGEGPAESQPNSRVRSIPRFVQFLSSLFIPTVSVETPVPPVIWKGESWPEF